ncbi:leucine-rich repeat domain-containing protein [Candidatus Regiella insecticola]|nr:leucine-rich repeat domain-containing protein [Candidatus Regiella insecticola]
MSPVSISSKEITPQSKEGTPTDVSSKDEITQKRLDYLVKLGLIPEEDRSNAQAIRHFFRDPDSLTKMTEMQQKLSEALDKVSTLSELSEQEQLIYDFQRSGIRLSLYSWAEKPEDTDSDIAVENRKKAAEEIWQCIDKGYRTLNLSGLNLNSLPQQMGLLVNLKELNMSGNQFDTIPADITKLTNLTSLDLSNNNLGALPIPSTLPSSPEAYELVALQNASTGTEHDVARIEELKQQLGNILGTEHTLSSLAALKELNLSGNRALGSLGYSVFPAGLEKLDVSNTGITRLPVSLFQDFPKGLPEGLKEINIIGCKKIKEIELTLMPKNLTIIHDGNTRFLVNGEEFNSEEFSENEWNIKMQKKVVSDIPEYI